VSHSDPVLLALRSATHAAHVRINHHPFLAGLTKPGFARDKYQALLQAYYRIYEAIEHQIDAFSTANQVAMDYSARRKLPWLDADLRYLGLAPHSEHWPLLRADIPALRDAGALIGTLYAIEGATLGGQVISRHLQSTLGMGANTGARFFNGYGDTPATQARWQEFCQFANTIIGNADLVESAKGAAVAVFDLIERQLNDLQARIDH
jgi:heme oxygenase